MSKFEIEFTINREKDYQTFDNQAKLRHLVEAYARIIIDLSKSKLKAKMKATDDSQILAIEGQQTDISAVLPIIIAIFSGDDEVIPLVESNDEAKLELAFAFYQILTKDEWINDQWKVRWLYG